ncbi:PGBD5 [Cordylochernes scorpioides]|uniref:PGBD5 n=1 Tax=Cordylochernes scorpioides TaxID=51811 RepID=A0ABY6JZX9_9ARAC|nr:PGBD5 [Cordylochernes scorpioides]
MPSTSGIDLLNVPEADEEFEDYFLADSGSELDDSIEDPQFTLEGLESDTTEIYYEESEEGVTILIFLSSYSYISPFFFLQIRQPTPEDEGWTECTNLKVYNTPRLREYWSNHIGMRTAFCKSTGMARERFEAILSMLHLNDNMLYIPHGQPGYDPIYKIRTLFDSLVNKFRTWYSPDEKLTIDEAICPFRGRVHFRVYIKGKPHKYGIKICESSTGYTCNLDIYTGRHPHQSLQYNSILSLVDRIAEPYYQKGHIIYFDRWFSSPQLFNHLWEKKTLAVGTVRHNRKGLPKKAFSKKLKKGESLFCQNSQLLALKWRDTRDVFMIATTQDSSMIQAQKKIRRQPQTISITKPAIVVDYNKNKAGVDISDQFMAYYPFHRRTLKWWKKLFFHIFGLTIVNSHIVYNKLTTGQKMPLREYHLAIIERLMEEAGTEILDEQPSASGSSERLIGKHFLTKIPATGKTTIQKRCKVCSDKGKRFSVKDILLIPESVEYYYIQLVNMYICIKESSSRKEPIIMTDFPDRPWKEVAMDLCQFEGKHFLVITDYYSRYPEFSRLDNSSAETVILHTKSIFARHEIPELVRTDNGPQFKNYLFQNFEKRYAFRHIKSSI